MSRQSGVFAGQDAALVGDKLLQQVGIFEVQRVDSEIDFGLGTRRANFGEGTAAAAAAFVQTSRVLFYEA